MKNLFIMCLLLLFGCRTTTDESFFTLQKNSYTGSELKIDGFYYTKWNNDLNFGDISYFYKNGVFLDISGNGEIANMNEYIKERLKYNRSEIKAGWGLFNISGENIVFEKWVGSEKGYSVCRFEGKVINDNSFVIKETSRIINGIKTEINTVDDKYYFQKFSPKADSTNVFIK